MLWGAPGLTLHSRSEPLTAAPRATTVCLPEWGCSRSDCHSNRVRATITTPRSTRSNRTLDSTRESIHDDVHAEAGVVNCGEAFAVRVIVPLGAVVLAAVENSDTIALHHGLKILVHQ